MLNDFTKNTILPIIVVLGALMSCMVSICFYHCIKFINQIRELKTYEKLQEKEDDEPTEESKLTNEKRNFSTRSSLKKNSLTLSLSSLPTVPEEAEYNTVEDLRDFLRLRNVVINAIYNHDRGYLQISVQKVQLYPLPGDFSGFLKLQYTISFILKDTQVFESEMRPIHENLRFDEKYRIYTPLSDADGAKMLCNFTILEDSFKRTQLWDVAYIFKPALTLSASNSGSVPEDVGTEVGLEKVGTVKCIREIRDDEARPKILLSLCYKPTAGRIFVRLVKGNDFPTSAHHVRLRICLVQTKYGSVHSFSSSIMRNARDMTVDETFTFGISVKNIQTALLIVSLLYGIHGKSFAPIAEARIGSLAPTTEGQKHWNDMLQSIREEVEAWHTLSNDVT